VKPSGCLSDGLGAHLVPGPLTVLPAAAKPEAAQPGGDGLRGRSIPPAEAVSERLPQVTRADSQAISRAEPIRKFGQEGLGFGTRPRPILDVFSGEGQ
jgi:hypothetical protein